jgi:protein TonB
MNKSTLEENQVAEEVEEVMITEPLETPPPPPVEVPEIAFSDQIDIVDDDIVVDTDLFISMEDDANLGVEIMDYVTDVYEEVIEEEAIPFTMVEERPTFMGGEASKTFSQWVAKNLQYPEVARENGIQGRVTLQFTVETDGSLKNIKVLRGIDPSLDKEAIRVVSSSPKWSPGRQRDKAVRVTYNFPVYFQLRN